MVSGRISSHLSGMLVLEENARKVLTDSGGVQEETHFLKGSVHYIRERTEWVETGEGCGHVLV